MAILVAVFAVVLFGMCAFVVDLGQAYVAKRQLQTGVDAGALAAALEFRDADGSCSNEAGWEAGAGAVAQQAAEASLEKNLPGADPGAIDARCVEGRLEIDFSADSTTDTVFASVIDQDQIAYGQQAAAVLEDGVSGALRPWGICTVLTPDVTVQQVSAANKENAGCPGIGESGTWNRYACPGQSKGDNNETVSWITKGCTIDARPVPDQPTSDPQMLSSYLRGYCTQGKNGASTEHCLTRDTGSSLNNPNIIEAWQSLVGQRILVPVFCGQQCDPDAMGSDGEFPIYSVAEVEVCGFNLAGNHSTSWPTGLCTDANTGGWASDSTVPGGENALYLVTIGWQGSDSGTSWDSEPEPRLIR